MSVRVEYARLERPSTGSFMTYRLPDGIHDDQVDEWVEQYLPGWEVIHTRRAD
jgi:predicted ATP-dependent Lon-type protease